MSSLFLLLFAAAADAKPFWDRPARLGLGIGLDLVVNLGPLDDRKRFGVAANGWGERVWLDRPYWTPTGAQPSPAFRGEVQMGWTPPVGFSSLSVQVGGLVADGFDGGYMPLGGLYGSAGLGIATDGSAGPLVGGAVVGPLARVRLDATRWDGGWHAPRLSGGPSLPLNCCNTLL